MAIARRSPRRPAGPKPPTQLQLEHGIQPEGSFVKDAAIDAWKQMAEERARNRHRELKEERRPCSQGSCKTVAVIWLQSWNAQGYLEPLSNVTYCLNHWPDGEGKALQSAYGWLPSGRPLADLGWNPNGTWGPAGTAAPSVHRRRNFGFAEGQC